MVLVKSSAHLPKKPGQFKMHVDFSFLLQPTSDQNPMPTVNNYYYQL